MWSSLRWLVACWPMWFSTIAADSETTCLGNDSDSSILLQVAKQRASKRSLQVLYSIGTGVALGDKLEACLKTWAADLGPDRLQIIGGKSPNGQSKVARWDPASACSDDHSGGACKDAVGLANGFESGAEWVMLVGPDNYVVPENVEKVLSRYNSSEPVVLGIKGCGDCPAGGLCGGGGQLFSRGALDKMIGGDRNSFLQRADKEARACGMWGDVQNCRLAAMNDVPVESLMGLRGWAEEIKQIREEMQSKSPLALTWHYVDTEKMQAVHRLRQKHPVETLQMGRRILSNAEQEIRYLEALDKYVKDEDERRKSRM